MSRDKRGQERARKDPLEVVRQFVADLREGRVKQGQAREIRRELEEVARRLQRVRALGGDYARVGLGEETEALLASVGRGGILRKFPCLRKAAVL
jgi:hypothetical protein